jgi:hypothetical protein
MNAIVTHRTRWPLSLLLGLAGALVVGLLVLAFAWPAATAEPRGLPVGISGSADQVRAVERAAARQEPDPVTFRRVPSRTEAVRRIRSRELVGAVLLGSSPEVLTASAAGSAQNQVLHGIASTLQTQLSAKVESGLLAKLQRLGSALSTAHQAAAAQLKASIQAIQHGRSPTLPAPTAPSAAPAAPPSIPTVRVSDVVPLSSTDPLGAGLGAASLPLVLGGMLGGVLISLLVVGAARRILALLVFGAAAGVVVTLILQTWLQVLQRDFLLNSAAFGLAMLATAALVVGCNSLLGTPGIVLGAVLSLLVANPISGAAVPTQFLPWSWGAIGQGFVPGAASTLVRSLSYFPNADTAPQWWTLTGWAVGGLLLTVAGSLRSRQPIPLPEREPEQAPTTKAAQPA